MYIIVQKFGTYTDSRTTQFYGLYPLHVII